MVERTASPPVGEMESALAVQKAALLEVGMAMSLVVVRVEEMGLRSVVERVEKLVGM